MDFSVLRDAPPPPDLQSGVGTFEPDPPGLREPGGSFMAALHQLHQRLRTDRSASPLEALALALRRANEDTKAAVLDDPVDYATYLIPSPRSTMLKVGPARVPPARRLPRFAPGGSVAGALRRLAARALPAFEEGAAAPYAPRGALSAVKPRGGQWLRGGELDAALQGFQPEGRRYTSEDLQYLQKNLAEMEAGGHSTPDLIDFQKGSIARVQRALARNAWINNQLRRYVERDMATPQDPLDELFLRGEGHLSAEQLAGMGLDPRGGPGTAVERANGPWQNYRWTEPRKKYGQPRSAWGELADREVFEHPVKQLLKGRGVYPPYDKGVTALEANSWLKKLDPESSAFDLFESNSLDRLGLDHVLDWLEQSGIPPERWKNVSVPQAARATGRWNAELAKKAEAARRASMEGLPRLKEYPSGYAWVELAAPRYSAETLPKGFRLEKWGYKGNPVWSIVDEKNITQTEAADSPEEALRRFSKGPHGEEILKRVLKEEGDAMGHCVGGYCDDVLSGRSRILSLRDAKTGRPEATVEVVPHRPIKELYDALVAEGMPTRTAEMWEEIAREPDEEIGDQRIRKMYDELVEASPKFKIQQIKGRFNAAPRPEVIPYIQDLVRSMGPWSEVEDLQNTGLTKFGKGYRTPEEVEAIFEKHFGKDEKSRPNVENGVQYFNHLSWMNKDQLGEREKAFLDEVEGN